MALTQALVELVETIGMEAAVELVRTYGRRNLYVPQHADARHEIALRIGLAAAQRLSAAYGGAELEVPPERTLLVEMRNAEIVRRIVEDGASISETAYAFGVTRRWVHRQLDLAGHPRLAQADRARTPQGKGKHEDPRQLRMWE